MAVRFVIGRAGTGKTRRAFDAIVERCRADPLGRPVYWILPKQATFTAERALTCESGLPAVARARVASFEQLGRDVLSECGGVAIPEITSLGRRMVLGHLLRARRNELRFFRSVAHQSGLASELDATFAELERRGRTVDEIASVARDLEDSAANDTDRALASKLHDLHLLYSAYSSYLGQDRLDPHRRLQQVLTCVEQSRRLRGAALFVDGFYDFSDYERRFLASVARTSELVEVSLTIDPSSPTLRDPHQLPDEMGVFHPIEDTYRKLHFAFVEAGAEVVREPVVLHTPARFSRGAAVAHVEKHLFWHTADTQSTSAEDADGRGVRFVEVPDRRAEVDAAAREAQRLVSLGCRLRDIAVLVRDLDAYHELIDASFREHGLPWFVDRRRSASHHPLIQFVRAVPTAALHGWDHDSVMTILKSGLVPLVEPTAADSDQIDAANLSAADELENYVLEHRIRGSAWTDSKPWTFRRHLLAAEGDAADSTPDPAATPDRAAAREHMARMNTLRLRMIEPLATFVRTTLSSSDMPPGRSAGAHEPNPAGPGTQHAGVSLCAHVTALYQVLTAFRVRETLERWIALAGHSPERQEQRAEHAQVWNDLCDLLDQMVELLGNEPMSLRDFTEVLETALESFDLALTPPTVDQILVGSVDRTRTPPGLRAAIVLGLHEGGFPKCPAENSILDDADRRSLRQHKIELDPDVTRRLFDERFFAYTAFTRPAEWLTVMRPRADDEGRPLAASQFWTELRTLFPSSIVHGIPRDPSELPECIGTPRQLVTALLRWARRGDGELKSEHTHPDRAARPSTGDVNVWPALYEHLARLPCDGRDLDRIRFRAWRALSYDNCAALSRDVAARLSGDPLHASVTRIETFAQCPFRHFARYGLKLEERSEADVTQLDLGNVYHGILDRLVRQMLANRVELRAESASTYAAEQIRLISEEVGRSLRDELLLSSARNKYLLGHVERTLRKVVDAASAAARRGKFAPWRTELCFGLRDERPSASGSSLPALTLATPSGRKVHLYGKIDRVDVLEERAAVAVIDYKLRGNKLDLHLVSHGLALQLLTYLLVLKSSGKSLDGRPCTPAAAFYVKLLRNLESVKHPSEQSAPTEEKFHLRVRPRGVLDESYVPQFDNQFLDGASEVLSVFVKKDGGRGANSEALSTEEFNALLKLAEVRLAQLADRIMDGQISVAPYRIGTSTPCPHCEYRSVCRFDPARQPYNTLGHASRGDVIAEALALTEAAAALPAQKGGKRRGR